MAVCLVLFSLPQTFFLLAQNLGGDVGKREEGRGKKRSKAELCLTTAEKPLKFVFSRFAMLSTFPPPQILKPLQLPKSIHF